MTHQQIIEAVPHDLLEKVAEFCHNTSMRKLTINKAESHYKLEYLTIDHVNR